MHMASHVPFGTDISFQLPDAFIEFEKVLRRLENWNPNGLLQLVQRLLEGSTSLG